MMRSERFKLLVAILETIMVNSLKKNPKKAKSRKQLHFNVSLQWISLHAISGNTNLFWSLLLLRLELYVCLYLKTKIKRISAQTGRSSHKHHLHHKEQIHHIPIRNALENFTFNIFNVNITDLFKRLSLETHLIHLFLRIGAILINDFIPSLYYWHKNVNLFLND